MANITAKRNPFVALALTRIGWNEYICDFPPIPLPISVLDAENMCQEKPATHYSSLFANNDKIIFSQKNLNFAKRGQKHPYTLFVIDSSFRECEFRLPSNEKSPLSFIQKPLRPAKTAQNAERTTHSRNVVENALHTIFVSQLFQIRLEKKS